MFLGAYHHTVDNKGRVFVPADFREELVGKFIISMTKDKCIKVYTLDGWEKFRERIALMQGSKENKSSRFLFRNAMRVELDGTGRILIPAEMREKAEIKKNVTIIGRDNLAEIWDEDLFAKYEEEEDIDEIMDYLEEDGIPS